MNIIIFIFEIFILRFSGLYNNFNKPILRSSFSNTKIQEL